MNSQVSRMTPIKHNEQRFKHSTTQQFARAAIFQSLPGETLNKSVRGECFPFVLSAVRSAAYRSPS